MVAQRTISKHNENPCVSAAQRSVRGTDGLMKDDINNDDDAEGGLCLTARLAIPPTYQTAALETAPPAYIAPHPPVSSERPESILLPPCPSPPSTSPSPPPPTHHQQQQQQEQQQQPPEYSPSVYSQHLSYHLSAAAAAADFGFPSSPRRPPPLFTKNVELEPAHLLPQEPHLARFKESRTDLEMRVDLEGGADVDAESGRERRIGGLGKDLIARCKWREGLIAKEAKRKCILLYASRAKNCHDPDGRGRPVPATSQFPSQRFAVDCR
ncbi:hypothetical protein BDR22DRAFT_822268 [Usnea florida]